MGTKQLWSGLFILAVTGPFLLAGLAATVTNIRLLRKGVRTRAKVVDYATSADGEGRYPIVTFRDQASQTHRAQLAVDVRSGRDGLVGVVYHRDNPAIVRGVTFAETWLVPLVGLGLGGAGVLAGVAVMCGWAPAD